MKYRIDYQGTRTGWRRGFFGFFEQFTSTGPFSVYEIDDCGWQFFVTSAATLTGARAKVRRMQRKRELPTQMADEGEL